MHCHWARSFFGGIWSCGSGSEATEGMGTWQGTDLDPWIHAQEGLLYSASYEHPRKHRPHKKHPRHLHHNEVWVPAGNATAFGIGGGGASGAGW